LKKCRAECGGQEIPTPREVSLVDGVDVEAQLSARYNVKHPSAWLKFQHGCKCAIAQQKSRTVWAAGIEHRQVLMFAWKDL